MADYLSARLTARGAPRAAIAAAAVIVILAGMVPAGCSRAPTEEQSGPALSVADVNAIHAQIAGLSRQQIQTLKDRVETLDIAVKAYLSTPDQETRTSLQQAWLEAHLAFSAARPLFYVGGHDDFTFQADAWPMEPGFLDSLPEYPDSGIINDTTLAISSESLLAQHGITDSEEVSIGFHPLEYYAFVRPIADFVPPAADTSEANEAAHIPRRRQAVSIIAALLAQMVSNLANEVTLPQSIESNAATASYDKLYMVLAGSRRAAHDGFQQASLIVDSDQGHSRFSQSSKQGLLAQAETLRQLYSAGSPLYRVLVMLNAQGAANLDSTLNQVVTALSNASLVETERARVPLMMSAISHELEDFERQVEQKLR